MNPDTPCRDETVRSAQQEMQYTTTESSVTGAEHNVSIPCQLRFTEPPNQDTERFHDALSEAGYTPLDANPTRDKNSDTVYYDGEIASETHWNRIRVVVFRGNMVRVFPLDDYVPTVDELRDLFTAICTGFNAPVTHDPIDHSN